MSDKLPGHDRFPGFMRWIKYRGPFLGFLMLSYGAFWVVILVAMAVTGEPVRDVVVFGLYGIAIICFVVFPLFVIIEVLDLWTSPYFERRWLALQQHGRILAKEPFHDEQRCKVSATEEVLVRHLKMTYAENARPMRPLQILHSKDGGQTWETLPLRLSPSARFACIFTAKWPPSSGSRKLACNNGGVSFEILGKGFERLRFMDVYEVLWLSVWRATYDPHRKWWTLKFVGSVEWVDLDCAK